MAGVAAVNVGQPIAQKPRVATVEAEPKPKLAGDQYKRSTPAPKLQPHPAAVHMRNGIFEVLGGSVLAAGGAVGVAMTLSAASVAVPIALGVVAVGGLAFAAKGVHDYGKGMAELLVELILLPVRIIDAFTGRSAKK